MIKELKLMNWKSFTNSTLFIDPITVLIGTNASGKSNTLDALLFLNRISSGIGITEAIVGDSNISSLRGGLEWICKKPESGFSLELIFDGLKKTIDYKYFIEIKINGSRAEILNESLIKLEYGPRSKNPIKTTNLYITTNDDSYNHGLAVTFYTGKRGPRERVDFNNSNTVLSQIRMLKLQQKITDGVNVVQEQLRKIFVFDPIPSHMRDFSKFSEKLKADGSNISGVLGGLPKDEKLEVEATLTKYLKGLPERDIKKVWTETVGIFKTDAMLYSREGWSGDSSHEVDARGMSDGTLRYLAIITALLTREKNSLLVIEEIDNGLHPSRAHILLDMLKELGKKRSIDVLITTHNPALLDSAGISMIPYITLIHRDNNTGSSKHTQLEDLQDLPKLLAQGNIGRLSAKGYFEDSLHREEKVE